MTLKEMLKEKGRYKKRVKELKEELDKYPTFLYLSTDDPMYDYLVGKHNALYDYEQSLEIIEELEKDYIPKDKIRELIKSKLIKVYDGSYVIEIEDIKELLEEE